MSEFSSLDNVAPAIPKETCPTIDKIIKEIDDSAQALSELTGSRGLLENLRAANEQLREVGIYWRESAKELSDQIDERDGHIAKLEDEIVRHENRYADMEIALKDAETYLREKVA